MGWVHRCLCSSLFKASSDTSFVASASDTRLPVNVSLVCYSQAWRSRKGGQDEDDDPLSVQRGWSRIAAGLRHVRIELRWQSPVKTKDTQSSGCCRPALQLCRKVFFTCMVSHSVCIYMHTNMYMQKICILRVLCICICKKTTLILPPVRKDPV